MYTFLTRWLHLFSVILVAILLSACGAGAAGNQAPPRGPSEGARPAGGAGGSGTTVKVVATNFAFALDPAQASAGTMTFELTNDSATPHDFEISGNGVKQKTDRIGRGETSSFTVNLAPGTYTYRCTVGGHDTLGMQGTFTVN